MPILEAGRRSSLARSRTMSVSAQISIYPLRQERLGPAVEAVRLALESRGLAPEVGAMSTLVTADADILFSALREAFEKAAAAGPVAMVLTVSNACPVEP
jgi:uncharacterized protein YqgV (UPF0045/DUF77 family)